MQLWVEENTLSFGSRGGVAYLEGGNVRTFSDFKFRLAGYFMRERPDIENKYLNTNL